jgi:hypothetical protein
LITQVIAGCTKKAHTTGADFELHAVVRIVALQA